MPGLLLRSPGLERGSGEQGKRCVTSAAAAGVRRGTGLPAACPTKDIHVCIHPLWGHAARGWMGKARGDLEMPLACAGFG